MFEDVLRERVEDGAVVARRGHLLAEAVTGGDVRERRQVLPLGGREAAEAERRRRG